MVSSAGAESERPLRFYRPLVRRSNDRVATNLIPDIGLQSGTMTRGRGAVASFEHGFQ